MYTENNNHEGNHVKLRIAIGATLGIVGASLVVPAMNSMLQPELVPWWAILLLVIGGMAIITGLLILIVPPKRWKHIWQSVLGFPTWLREIYTWHKYGPKCIIEMPVIDFELYPDDQTRRYSAKVFLTVFISEKTSDYYPVRCSFRNISFQLEQKHGLMPLHASLELNPVQSLEIILKTPGKTTHRIGLSWFPYNNPAIVFIDLQKPYTWIIKGIHVYLGNLRRYRKLSRKRRVFNGEKTQL